MARALRLLSFPRARLFAICVLGPLVLGTGSAVHAQAQPEEPAASSADTVAARPDSVPDPKEALWRAAAVPGWGQLYNGDYLKLPVLYGTLGGMTGLIIALNRLYTRYDRAFLYRAYQVRVESGRIDSHPYPGFESDYQTLVDRHGSLSPETLERQRDKFRRNRDLTIIGLGIAYGLSIVDAYVSAHLATFDVSENLSVQLRPSSEGAALTVRW